MLRMVVGDHGGGEAEFRPFAASTAHHGIIEGEAAPLLPAFPASPSEARSLATSESGTLKVMSRYHVQQPGRVKLEVHQAFLQEGSKECMPRQLNVYSPQELRGGASFFSFHAACMHHGHGPNLPCSPVLGRAGRHAFLSECLPPPMSFRCVKEWLVC